MQQAAGLEAEDAKVPSTKEDIAVMYLPFEVQ